LAGERYDIVISADQAISSYWIKVIGHHQCKNHQEAMLVYDGATLPQEMNEATKSSLNVSNPHFSAASFVILDCVSGNHVRLVGHVIVNSSKFCGNFHSLLK
jgi:hypothetical protein